VDLKAFTKTLPVGGVARMAAELRITPVYLAQLSGRQNGREPSPELCVEIERASGRAVMRWDLRPDDWHRIWPELIAAEGAPAAPLETRTDVARPVEAA
jgi:DNA-binding transcriptional regulator YdaS (Cro superfamily)